MTREISFDTETTGLDPRSGHRVIEIGCVEMIDRVPTGKHFHQYINPQRDVPAEAAAVHGLTEEMLKDKPIFSEIANDFRQFVGDATLIIHNAAFDMKFINAELTWAKLPEIPWEQSFCTLKEARKRFPGAQNSLDALCKRFNIDNSMRDKHGALLDADLLASMYLELMGGAQNSLELVGKGSSAAGGSTGTVSIETVNQPRPARAHAPSAEELQAHEEFLTRFKDPLWSKQS